MTGTTPGRFGNGFWQKAAIALASMLLGATPPWLLSWVAFFRDTPNRTQVEVMIEAHSGMTQKDIQIIKETLLEGKIDRRDLNKLVNDINSRVTRIEGKLDAKP